MVLMIALLMALNGQAQRSSESYCDWLAVAYSCLDTVFTVNIHKQPVCLSEHTSPQVFASGGSMNRKPASINVSISIKWWIQVAKTIFSSYKHLLFCLSAGVKLRSQQVS